MLIEIQVGVSLRNYFFFLSFTALNFLDLFCTRFNPENKLQNIYFVILVQITLSGLLFTALGNAIKTTIPSIQTQTVRETFQINKRFFYRLTKYLQTCT